MSGGGTVIAVMRTSVDDRKPVWQLWIDPSAENASARAFLQAQRPDAPPVRLAVNISRAPDPSDTVWTTCPIAIGTHIKWDEHNVYAGSGTLRFKKIGFEIDVDAPLSPA